MSKDNGMKDKLKGAAKKAEGEVKEKTGRASDNPELQHEGNVDKAKGKVHETVGKAKDDRADKF
ncbi:CsbD family protein [Rossellomorea vietnamensis]|uniref:CsbD family protein n=1 Tax=Rossellomorea vietnamensis TaxID=218284 RepID=UPI003CF572C4